MTSPLQVSYLASWDFDEPLPLLKSFLVAMVTAHNRWLQKTTKRSLKQPQSKIIQKPMLSTMSTIVEVELELIVSGPLK